MKSLFLSDDELIGLTNRRMRTAQVKALRGMGIQHKLRPDGSPVILRSHIEKILCGTNREQARIEIQPDWSTINAPKKKPRK
jgi:hypothetical protein